jgi:HD-GYP domain-containing protein (c-di-GMP phosphodiesterase class II)
LFALADVYDALISNRPYRSAWPKEDAVQYIESQSGTHFDPRIVPEFLDLVNVSSF